VLYGFITWFLSYTTYNLSALIFATVYAMHYNQHSYIKVYNFAFFAKAQSDTMSHCLRMPDNVKKEIGCNPNWHPELFYQRVKVT